MYLPHVPVLPPRQAVQGAQVILIGVPDDMIQGVCSQISTGLQRGVVLAHLSGSLGLEVLASAAHWGISPLALHPLQSIPDVRLRPEAHPGRARWPSRPRPKSPALVGDRLARDAGGRPFRIRSEDKPLYHAAAVFASNYLTTVEAIAERLFAAAGVQDTRSAMGPLAIATLSNVIRQGPAAALTGPVVRGDVGTIERNLEALKQGAPEAIPAYVALARAALGIADQDGSLPWQDVKRVEEVLRRWM